jgi:hypothetical protein
MHRDKSLQGIRSLLQSRNFCHISAIGTARIGHKRQKLTNLWEREKEKQKGL